MFSGLMNGVEERAHKIAEECNDEAIKELAPAIEASYQQLFNESVSKWYGAFSPEYYIRRESMKNIAEFTSDTENYKFKIEFIQDRMGKDRKGGDLFEKVFVQGWHGGGSDGRVLRYRKPVPISAGGTYDGKGWFLWGREAVRTPSALMLFDEQFEALVDEWKNRIADLTIEKFRNRQSEIFGFGR